VPALHIRSPEFKPKSHQKEEEEEEEEESPSKSACDN
jgi:hypothetical protein